MCDAIFVAETGGIASHRHGGDDKRHHPINKAIDTVWPPRPDTPPDTETIAAMKRHRGTRIFSLAV